MPYQRPTLTQLQNQAAQDLNANLPGADALLRFTNLGVLAMIQAGMTHMLFAYLDWIAKQSTPATATDEFLAAWASLKNVFREPATQATGTVTFPAVGTPSILVGAVINRGDGYSFVATASAVAAGGFVTVPVKAVADPNGQKGAIGNGAAGTAYTLANAVAGVTSTSSSSTAFTGGADIEGDDSLRARMLLAYQNPPHGGSRADYVQWALAVPGVTRAWCVPNFLGSGTVGVYVMFDVAESAHGGFPQGTDGVSSGDIGPGGGPRDVVATGDQLAVVNAIISLQPVTALVYGMSPVAAPQNFVIAGLSSADVSTKAAISAAINGVFLDHAQVTGGSSTVHLSDIEAAIAAVPGTAGFVITSPTGDIVTTAGQLPTLGTVTYS
jgi:uncharacterized phage protein gp47/JayE